MEMSVAALWGDAHRAELFEAGSSVESQSDRAAELREEEGGEDPAGRCEDL